MSTLPAAIRLEQLASTRRNSVPTGSALCRVNNPQVYPCDHCGHKAASLGKLDEHIENYHRIKKTSKAIKTLANTSTDERGRVDKNIEPLEDPINLDDIKTPGASDNDGDPTDIVNIESGLQPWKSTENLAHKNSQNPSELFNSNVLHNDNFSLIPVPDTLDTVTQTDPSNPFQTRIIDNIEMGQGEENEKPALKVHSGYQALFHKNMQLQTLKLSKISGWSETENRTPPALASTKVADNINSDTDYQRKSSSSLIQSTPPPCYSPGHPLSQ